MIPPGRLQPRGSNQVGLRQYNERVVLHAVRLHGSLASAGIARLTHLSAQTVSLITKRLLDEGLLTKGDPQRGKVGQPSVPLSLDPNGAFSIGIKIGRRSLDVLLVNFLGEPSLRLSKSYVFPDPDTLFDDITERVQQIVASLGSKAAARLQGVGVAAPLSLGGWRTLLGVQKKQAEKWHGIDIRQRVADCTGLPVQLVKDTAAACVAELVAGRGRELHSFLYVFVDTLIGGGLVIGSHLHAGHHGNAGAVGSMALGFGAQGETAPLLSVASLVKLETAYQAAKLNTSAVADERALQPPWAAITRVWLADAAPAIAHAVHHAACLLDLESVVLDGAFSPVLREALATDVRSAMARLNWEGVSAPDLVEGAMGSDARALGGALLPLYSNFAPDSELFLKLQP